MHILEEIHQDKLIEVRNRKKLISGQKIHQKIKDKGINTKSFIRAIEQKIQAQETAIIAEIKKASPSKGIIRKDFNPVEIAKIYQENGATCISILTDQKYFMGKDEYLTAIRQITNLPILRKDFIIDPYQILESKLIGADCILLIMAMLKEDQAIELEKQAIDIGLDVLAEIHNHEELEQALKLKTKLIGINNRNLKTLQVDINLSKELSQIIPDNKIIICESGIKNKEDINNIKAYGINGFLIGESLMKEKDIGAALKRLF